MRTFKRLVGVLISILILGFGLALIFKAQVGAGPYDAVSQTLSLITNIKIGTEGKSLRIEAFKINIV